MSHKYKKTENNSLKHTFHILHGIIWECFQNVISTEKILILFNDKKY